MNFASLMSKAASNANLAHSALQRKRAAEEDAARQAKEDADRREDARRKRSAQDRAHEVAVEEARRSREGLRLAEHAAKRTAARESASPPPPVKRRRLGRDSTNSPAPRSRQIHQLKSSGRSRSASPSATDARRVHVINSAASSPGSQAGGLAGLKASFDPTAVVALNQKKRDLRSVDEVERDLRAQRQGRIAQLPSLGALFAQTAPAPERSVSPLPATGSRGSRKTASPSPIPEKGGHPDRSRGKPSGAAGNRLEPLREASAHRPRSPSPLRRPAPYDYSAEIRNMFRRPTSRPRVETYSDEDSSDMEGDAHAVLREEQRASRLARREDEEEERRLAKHKAEKEARKAAAKQSRH